MIKRFKMYIPLVDDTEIVPITYEFLEKFTDGWLCYKNISGNNEHYYITQKCIDDFIQKGYIYDIKY